ncbi:MAG TPA: hypothetical protein VIN08_18515 [Ohtaekwangia sp.]|uniref:hypothetical protein n=1 Tax=Ohtaekwangia sp. TaxID=2066019 RepID=UPI002F925FFB
MKKFLTHFTRVLLFTALSLVILSARVDDLPEDVAAHAEKITGTYQVTDQKQTSASTSYYEITIARSSANMAVVELHNFGNVMYVPVKAVVQGNNFYIQPQTFKGKTISILLSGSGTLTAAGLHFSYTINTGKTQLTHQCEATRK